MREKKRERERVRERDYNMVIWHARPLYNFPFFPFFLFLFNDEIESCNTNRRCSASLGCITIDPGMNENAAVYRGLFWQGTITWCSVRESIIILTGPSTILQHISQNYRFRTKNATVYYILILSGNSGTVACCTV